MIIGIGHRKQVGKDTAANFLDSRGLAKKMSLSEPLYHITQILFHDMKSKEYYDVDGSRKNDLLSSGMTVRETLIAVSEGLKESLGDRNIWWNVLAQRATLYSHVVIADIRYPEEAENVKKAYGYLIRIDRPDAPNTSDKADDALLDYDGWDCVIENTGNLFQLESKIIQAYSDAKTWGN